jgi:hypothetical protein
MKATVKVNDRWLEEFTLDTEKAENGTVYDTLEDAMSSNGTGYGCTLTVLTREQLNKIKEGGVLCIDDGEYVHYIAMKDTEEEPPM